MAGAVKENYTLVIIAALNMIAALYYYLKVIKAMFMDRSETPIEALPVNLFPKTALMVCMIGMIVTGLYGEVYAYIHALIAAQ